MFRLGDKREMRTDFGTLDLLLKVHIQMIH